LYFPFRAQEQVLLLTFPFVGRRTVKFRPAFL
jgi:hypothetical protein